MPKKYSVHLSNEEQQALENIVTRGNGKVRQIGRAHTLLRSNVGKTDQEIADLSLIQHQLKSSVN